MDVNGDVAACAACCASVRQHRQWALMPRYSPNIDALANLLQFMQTATEHRLRNRARSQLIARQALRMQRPVRS
jgi:hypothetical protein